jgi:hypothetical protein
MTEQSQERRGGVMVVSSASSAIIWCAGMVAMAFARWAPTALDCPDLAVS